MEIPSSTLVCDPPIEIVEEQEISERRAPRRSPAEKPKTRRTLIVVVLVALALRVGVTLLPIGGDQWHIRQQGNVAVALLEGRGFGSLFNSKQVSAVMPPVYPLIVAVFFKVFGVRTMASILAVHVFDSLLSALACIPVFLMARRSFGERVGWWAAWGWAFSPYGIYFAATWAWSTHLQLLCLCWLLYLAQDLEQSTRLSLWAGFGLLAGFAGLTEPSVLVVIPFLLALACWRLRVAGKQCWLPGLLACMVMAATISPWIIRNAMVFHRFIPMRDNIGLELWLGNNGRSLHWTNDDLNPQNSAWELAEYDRKGELAYMDHKMEQARTYISDHPAWYAWMCVRRAVYLWTGYWSFNRDYLAQEPMDLANIPFTTCLTLLALLGLVIAWPEKPWESIRCGGVLFLFPVMYYFVHPGAYRMRPLDPLIVILGCRTILAIRLRRLRRFRPAATLAALLCLSAMCTPATAQVTQLPTWVERNPATSPPPTAWTALAYDAAAGNMVFFGGDVVTGLSGSLIALSNDTWIWNGSTWTQEYPASPTARCCAAMVYDTADSNVVLFGGQNDKTQTTTLNVMNDTWVWNGSTWTEDFPAVSPVARDGAAMTYDAATGDVVLFGGLPGSSYMCETCMNDTWVWNGNTWTQQFPAASPSARYGATMAYDATTGNVVLFAGGGESNGMPVAFGDTWIWNGSTWTEEFPATSPPARVAATMAYDTALGSVVLFGGVPGSGAGFLNDTWLWNGSTWTELNLTNSPPGRFSASMAYDAAAQNVVLFGGQAAPPLGFLNDTWTLGVSAVNLGTAYVCPAGAATPSPCSQTATIPFSVAAGTTIGSIGVLTQGAANLDFTLNSATTTCAVQTYSSTTTCTVGVTFTPRYAGARSGAVVIEDGSNVLATAYIYGTGIAPEAVFDPGATSALGGGFGNPSGVAVDASGNVYVADWGNSAVKEMPAGCTASSCVTTLGGGFATPSGVAVDGAGNVYIADSGNNAVKEMPAGCTASSCVTTLGGGFNYPGGAAVDGSGNVYVADWGNNAVKEMLPGCTASRYSNGNCVVSTLGNGFGAPEGVTVDGVGNVYVADTGNNAVKMMTPGCTASSYNNGTCAITTLGGGFNQPSGIAVDAGGDVYVADSSNNAVKEMPPGCTASSYNNGTCTITTLGGGFNLPFGVALDGSGNVYAGDSGNNAVKEINRLTPPSLSFAETNVGKESSDSPQTVGIENVGNEALTFPIPSSGNDPSISTGFQLDSSTTCPQVSTSSSAGTLAASASCTLAVDFVPTVTGSITGSLVLTDNNMNAAVAGYASQAIALSGTGKASPITLSPASLPAATYGASYSATITASGGTAPYAYSVSTGSLPTGLTLNSRTGAISGLPTVTGSFSFTIEATDGYSFTGTENYTLIVNDAALTIVANNATKIYGTANPAFTGTVAGAENGNTFTESFSTTATLSSPVGTYPIVPSVTGTDLADYAQSVTDGTLTVTQAASATSVQVSNTSITPGQSVTLTATVVDASAGSTGTPTGTVKFYDNGTLLNAAALSTGVASYSTTSLTPGSSNVITATYSSDTNFTASSSTGSTATTIAVAPLGFTFAISGSSTASVARGQSATYQAAITPLYGSYPGTVSFTATGLPSGAAASFSPSSITANGGAQTVTVTITTASVTALLHRAPPSAPSRRLTPLALACLVLLGAGRLRRRGRMLRRLLCALAFLGTGLAVVGLSGCSAVLLQVPQSYTLTVTATAGSVQHTATVTLNVHGG